MFHVILFHIYIKMHIKSSLAAFFVPRIGLPENFNQFCVLSRYQHNIDYNLMF